MPQKISSKEVLLHLNELGYVNISRQQLKEFIQDLKLVIKYDQKKRREESTVAERKAEPDVAASMFTKDTISSKAKCVRKSNIISVQIKRPQLNSRPASHCTHLEDVPVRDVPPSTVTSSTCTKQPEICKGKSVQTKNSKVSTGQHTMSTKTKISQSASRPTTSFIRPTFSIPSKSDPVALYMYYQTEWKKQKIPGENSHSDLRWVIRERMLSGPRGA